MYTSDDERSFVGTDSWTQYGAMIIYYLNIAADKNLNSV